MADPSFVATMQNLQQNPNAMGSMLGGDPRMSKALGVLLGVDLSAMGGGAQGGPRGAQGANMGNNSGVSVDEDMGDSDDEDDDGVVKDEKPSGGKKFTKVGEMSPEEAAAMREQSYKAAGKPMPEPTKVLTEEERKAAEEEAAAKKAAAEEAAAKAKVRAEADAEKNKGNELYKKRDFPGAIAHYEKALTIDPSNIVYYNNLSAVFMEQKDYAKAIETAAKGAAVGKEHMASYTDVAKAYARIGAAHQAQGQLDSAIDFYQKSLLEDYNDKTKQALKKIEEEKKKAEQLAYIDPVKSEEHKAKGNEHFNAGKYVDAIGEYTEAIKRDPKNYKVSDDTPSRPPFCLFVCLFQLSL